MTEKEKMLNSELYMPDNDEALFNERIKCKTLCHKYNNLSPDKIDERKEVIKQIIGKTQNKYWIEHPSLFIEKLLETLHSSTSPYKNLSKKEFIALENKIKQITTDKLKDIEQKGSAVNGFYQYIEFVGEPQEYARITKSVDSFTDTFSISNL